MTVTCQKLPYDNDSTTLRAHTEKYNDINSAIFTAVVHL